MAERFFAESYSQPWHKTFSILKSFNDFMEKKMTKAVLFQNVNVFDGEHEKRIEKANVLVEGNTIQKVSTEKIEAGDATVIDGAARRRDARLYTGP